MVPEKPLKILTLDGGGLQAISTLLTLDKLLSTVAENSKVPYKKPRPCDVFDTIAGIGAGGWLAILLGRFHMDITTCLSEWYKIIRCIAPRSKSEEILMRAFQRCYFNPDRLVEQVEYLTKEYGTGEYLFDTTAADVRTKYVFVAALQSDAEDYNLFRAYDIPKSAEMPQKLRKGPRNPKLFKISRAFGVTGSSKFFREQMAKSGGTRFNDKFPKPHNITELALDEMWGIFGTTMPISIVVNIGPGLPSKCDVEQIARRFSWGMTIPTTNTSKRSSSPLSQTKETMPKKSRTKDPDSDQGPNTNLVKQTTFRSISNRGVKQLRLLQEDIEADIRDKLNFFYENGSELYYRLVPEQAPLGTVQNDTKALGLALDRLLPSQSSIHSSFKKERIIDWLTYSMVSDCLDD